MTVTDEETPLLHNSVQEDDELPVRERERVKETPIPWGQFSITLVLQLAEPMSSQVIYPFLPQLIRETGVTKGDDKKVAYYVGIMQSIFFATQAMTVLHWSRISDRVGRKPVILVGLAGLSLSMFCFGLARSFPALVIARSLNGALNGNIGVVKSMMGEMTDATNVARAFAYQPISWSTGATIGPLIGGALSHPTERFPGLLGESSFLKSHPYFLPCSIPATFSILAWLVTLFLLKETNPTGFAFRTFLGSLKSRLKFHSSCSDPLKLDPGHDSRASSIPDALPLKRLLTRPVLLSTTAYALLSLLDIAYRALQPTFYASPRSLGGLALPPSTIGSFLAVLGFANGVFQVGFFARLTKRWGNRKVYLVGIASACPIFALFPIMSAVVRAEDAAADTRGEAMSDDRLSPLLIALVTLQLALTLLLNMCYGSVFIFITAAASAIPLKPHVKPVEGIRALPSPGPAISSSSSSATLVPTSESGNKDYKYHRKPSTAKKLRDSKKSRGGKRTLGAVNGIAQCTVSIMRCVGPYSASALFAKGLAWEYGKDAGSRLPGDGGPVADPLPESVGVYALVVNAGDATPQSGLVTAMLDDAEPAMMWRRLGGLMVYGVMITLVIITLIIGSRLPEVPWGPAKEDDDEAENEGGQVEEVAGGRT
ncbi:hypothetical protein ACEPAI_4521 [Sanghuangporus weigelae]